MLHLLNYTNMQLGPAGFFLLSLPLCVFVAMLDLCSQF